MAATRSEPAATSEQTLHQPLTARLAAAAMATWGAFIGVLPHVLHHAGPLAGAALIAGATGKFVFAAVGLVASIPLLRRLYRRFDSWVAPAGALAVFAAAFAISTFVIGPALNGDESNQQPGPSSQQPAGHASHHSP